MDAIRDIISTLYVDDIIISDYEILPDGGIKVLVGGDTLEVGPDLDPEHPELDAEARGYIWALYDGDGSSNNAVDHGGDYTVDTLAATIKRLADR